MTSPDISALTAPATSEEIRAFRRESPRVAGLMGWGGFIATSVLAFGAALFISFVASNSGSASNGSGSTSWITLLILVAIFGLGLTGLAFFLRASWRRAWRITRFAQANGLHFSSNDPAPAYAGMIFNVGKKRSVQMRLMAKSGAFFDFGTYRYTTGSGKNQKQHSWGYIAIKLDRMVPQIILDAKTNNFLGSNLPNSFARNQVLSLEGDFDRHFTLYCPKEYERDALYIFTPDLMALLIDHATAFDVELVDDWMFLYSSSRLNISDVATIRRVYSVLNTVGAKTLTRTNRYADSNVVDGAPAAASAGAIPLRMVNNTIAPKGRRLQKRVPLATIAIVVAVIAWWWFTVGTHTLSM